MSFVSHLEEFFIGKTDWFEYEKHVECYFMANGINDKEKKRDLFLSV